MNENDIITELEHDFLIELFNIGIGQAAASLSDIVNQEIILSVPDVEYIKIDELSERLGLEQDVCSVSQSVSGSFEANSMLIFPEPASLKIVGNMLGEEYSNETISALHQEGFSEIGNILLNACIGSLSQSLNENFDVGLPVYKMGNPDEILENTDLDSILFIKINLTLSESNLEGYLVFLLGQISFKQFKKLLNNLIKGIENL